MTDPATKPIPVPAPQPRRRHRLRTALITLAVVVVVLVLAAVIGDRVFRGYAEGQIGKSVETSLPKGVEGSLSATIQGGWAFPQWLHGSFDHVTVRSSRLTVLGADASAKVEAYGLPVNGGALKNATGTFTVGQGALSKLAPLAAADASAPKLGNGTVSTSIERTIVGVPITVDVTLVPSVRGQYVRLNPTKAQLRSGAISVPGTALIRTLLPDGISVCAAKYLPPGVRLTSVRTRTGSATLTFVADRLDLANLQSGRTGSCS